MAVSIVEICNMALTRVGAARITSITADTVEAALCNQFYGPARIETLLAYPWSFATRRTVLAASADPTFSPYDYKYALPTSPECLTVLGLVDVGGETYTDLSDDWTVEGGQLHTNVSPCLVKYVSDVTEPHRFPRLFTMAVSLRLAMMIAIKLTQDMNLFNLISQEYMAILQTAKMQDGSHRRQDDALPEDWSE